MEIAISRKGLMKLGKWSLAVLSVVLIGYFLITILGVFASPRYGEGTNVTSQPSGLQYSPGRNYGFQINWTEQYDGVDFRFNMSNASFQVGRPDGTLVNFTNSTGYNLTRNDSAAGNNTFFINLTQEQLGPAGTYNISWFGTNATGASNTTGLTSYFIAAANTSITLYLNSSTNPTGAANTNASVNRTDLLNITAQINVTGLKIELWSNFTGSNARINSSFATTMENYTNTANLAINTMYNITAVFNDTSNTNYTATSRTLYLNVTDTVAPTIFNLAPKNLTYINGTSSQLFEINLTDRNVNFSARNASLGYRKSGTTTFTNVSMKCITNKPGYLAPTNYCNVTVDLSISPWTEGSVVQFFYNYTDMAGNIGNNGTDSALNNVTIDRTPPAPSDIRSNDSDNVIGYTDTINLSAQWTDTYSLSGAWLEANGTSDDPADFRLYSQMVLSGTTALSNFSWSNSSSILIGKVIAWRIYANDSANNTNVTATNTFTIDGTAPQWSANTSSSPTNYSTSILTIFNITWTDNVGMSTVSGVPAGTVNASKIEINYTGAMVNYSMIDFGNGIFTFNRTLGAGSYQWRFYGNDTSNNRNTTPYWNLTIGKTGSTMSLYLNGTAANKNYNVLQVVNVTAELNVSGKTINVSTNITGWDEPSAVTPLYNNTSLPVTATRYNFTAYWNGDANYTAASQTYFVTAYGYVNASAATVNTSWIKSGSGINVTCTVTNSKTSDALEGYYLEVYNGTVNLTAGRTRSNGAFDYQFVPLAEGAQTLTCAVYDNTTHYYNASGNRTVTFTSDFTSPVLNFPTPVNNTYVTGSSSQLFQINVTDTNLNLTTNASVSYRLSPLAWSSATLNCWPDGSTGRYRCNKTVDLSSFAENDVIQYFFNATDNATNSGNNGTQSVPLNITVDRTAPRYSSNSTNDTDNTIGTNDYINLSARWTDNYALSVAILQTNETTDYQNKSTLTLSGTAANANFTWSNTSSALIGKVIAWRIYVNDTAGNQNVTSNDTFTIDGTAPRWGEGSNVTTVANGTQYAQGVTYRFNITVSDAVSVDKVLLEWRDSTGITNYSATRFNGTVTDGSWSVTFVDLKANETGYQFRWFMNDTTNNQNTTTGLISYFVMKAPVNVTLLLNSSASNQTISYSQYTNITANMNVSTLTFTLYRNSTQINTGTGVLTNITNSDFIGNRTYNITADFPGNANYTSNNVTLYINVNKANSSIVLWLNTTAGNVTYNKSVVVGQNAQTNSTGNIKIYNNFTGTLVLAGSANNTLNVTNDTLTLNLANYSILANVTGNENYTDSTSITYYVNLVDSIIPNISAASLTPTGVFRYQNITINATITDNDFITWSNNFAWARIGFANGSYISANVSLTNYTDTKWSANFNTSNFTLGVNNVTVYANDSSKNVNNSAVSTYTLWGLSNLSEIIVPSSISSSQVVTVACLVKDRNTTQGINNYPVSFWQNDSSLLTTNNTNSTGWAIHAYSQATPAGYSIKCNITANSTLYYNLTEFSSLNATTTVSDTTAPTLTLPVYTNSTARKAGNTLTLNVSITESGSGIPAITTCNVTIGGSSAGSIAYGSNWCNGTITVPSLTEGNKTINITINDTANNIGFNDSTVLLVDNSTPTLTINNPTTNTYIKLSGSRIWVNGTVYDNLRMGTGNVTTNDSRFVIYSFNGTNNTAFNISNTSSVTDGYIALNVSNLDDASNNGSAVISFYSDNTVPSSATGNTTGYHQVNSSQIVQVTIVDNLKTNDTITLWYKLPGVAWNSTTMTGTPGTTTTYNATIDTSELIANQTVRYYITGSDNATNTITNAVGGTAASPLANFSIASTGAIDGYIIQNGTSTTYITGATVSVNDTGVSATVSGSNGYYYISGLVARTYVVMVNATNYISNQSAATTVTVGSTSRVNVTIANNATGIIQGNVYQTNTSAKTNYTVQVSDGTRTVSTNSNGFYQITGVPAGTYTLSATGDDYWANSTSVTVSVGTTTTANLYVIGPENFNVSRPTRGFFNVGWNDFWLTTQVFGGATTNYTIANLTASLGSNFTIIYRYNTTNGWTSYVPGAAGNDLVAVNSSDDHYYIKVNATERLEIERRY